MQKKAVGPIYQQIANNIEQRIYSGDLQNGERLQSEREMSSRLGVNRLTVRRAFNVLRERGLVDRRHGGGTYVTTPRIERFAGKFVPFTLAIRALGMQAGARGIKFEQTVADESIAQLLRLPVSAAIYDIVRVRLANGEPAMLEQWFISAERFPNFEQHDHVDRSGYEIMETEYGVSAVRATQSLEPVIATTYEAQLLDIEGGDPLMLERRLTFDPDGHPIEYGKDLYRGDKFKFITTDAELAMNYSQRK
ncbi:MAG: GntR family transcriptional regulator [Candidatus Promineifilaceae bacterium]